MYAKYVYKAGATSVNILADLCRLIAGAALADLSGDCVKASSTLAGVSTGWSVVDAVSNVISAPFEDGLANKIFQLTYASGTMKAAVAESWNAVSHVGTNVTTGQGVVTVNSTSQNTLFLAACAENVAVWDAAGNWLLLAEISRAGTFTKNRAAAFVARNGVNTLNICRVKNPVALGDSLNLACSMLSAVAPHAAGVRGDSESVVYQTWPLNIVILATQINQYLYAGPVRGVVMVPQVGVCGDTMADDAGNVLLMLPVGVGGNYLTLGAVRK